MMNVNLLVALGDMVAHMWYGDVYDLGVLAELEKLVAVSRGSDLGSLGGDLERGEKRREEKRKEGGKEKNAK